MADNAIQGLLHQIWAAAQLAPGEGIQDGIERIADLLGEQAPAAQPLTLAGYVRTGALKQTQTPGFQLVGTFINEKPGNGLTPIYLTAQDLRDVNATRSAL